MKGLSLALLICLMGSPVLALTGRQKGSDWARASIGERLSLTEAFAKAFLKGGFFGGWTQRSVQGYLYRCMDEVFEVKEAYSQSLGDTAKVCAMLKDLK